MMNVILRGLLFGGAALVIGTGIAKAEILGYEGDHDVDAFVAERPGKRCRSTTSCRSATPGTCELDDAPPNTRPRPRVPHRRRTRS